MAASLSSLLPPELVTSIISYFNYHDLLCWRLVSRPAARTSGAVPLPLDFATEQIWRRAGVNRGLWDSAAASSAEDWGVRFWGHVRRLVWSSEVLSRPPAEAAAAAVGGRRGGHRGGRRDVRVRLCATPSSCRRRSPLAGNGTAIVEDLAHACQSVLPWVYVEGTAGGSGSCGSAGDSASTAKGGTAGTLGSGLHGEEILPLRPSCVRRLCRRCRLVLHIDHNSIGKRVDDTQHNRGDGGRGDESKSGLERGAAVGVAAEAEVAVRTSGGAAVEVAAEDAATIVCFDKGERIANLSSEVRSLLGLNRTKRAGGAEGVEGRVQPSRGQSTEEGGEGERHAPTREEGNTQRQRYSLHPRSNPPWVLVGLSVPHTPLNHPITCPHSTITYDQGHALALRLGAVRYMEVDCFSGAGKIRTHPVVGDVALWKLWSTVCFHFVCFYQSSF